MSYDPCISRQTPLYMHRPDVLAAIHASSHPNPRWPSDQPGWAYGDEKEDIALLFPKFFKQAPHWNIGACAFGRPRSCSRPHSHVLVAALTCARTAIVSGTADAAVPFIGTERWMECLGQPVLEDWKLWYLNQDVAGAVKAYQAGSGGSMQFISVKGCGHTIPTYCPEAGFAMLDNWLNPADGREL